MAEEREIVKCRIKVGEETPFQAETTAPTKAYVTIYFFPNVFDAHKRRFNKAEIVWQGEVNGERIIEIPKPPEGRTYYFVYRTEDGRVGYSTPYPLFINGVWYVGHLFEPRREILKMLKGESLWNRIKRLFRR